MSGSTQNAELELYEYNPYEGRPKIEWPNGARLACWVHKDEDSQVENTFL